MAEFNKPMDPEQPTAPAGLPGQEDREAQLFENASDIAKALYRDSKRVRRTVERRLWWQQNKPKA